MGVVTLDAHAVLEGRMLFVAPRLEIVERMALLTETADVLLLQRKRLSPVRGVMAHVAAPRHDRVVRALFQEFRLVRGVGIVADRAGLSLNRIICVRLHERRAAAFVTGEAKRRLRLDEEVRLVRAVGKMARLAPLRLKDLVHRLLFKKLLLVAAIAEVLAFSGEQMVPLRGMRVMEARAFSRFPGGVAVVF